MAKKTTKKAAKSNELDGKEFFAAVTLIEKEKGIPRHYMLEKITQALVSAYKRDHEGVTDNVFVEANEITETVRMYVKKEIVEEVTNPATEIALAEARKSLPSAQSGDVVRIEIKPRNFGRIAAQTARQVIIQGMREAEHSMIYDMFSSKEHEMLVGTVTRVDPRNGAVTLRITSDGESTDAYLSPSEQVRGEVAPRGRPPEGLCGGGPPLQPRAPDPDLPHPPRPGQAPVRAGSARDLRRHRGDHAPSPARRAAAPRWPSGPHDENVDPIGACVGPKRRPREQHRRRAGRREDRHRQVQRRPRPVCGRRPVPRRCALRRDRWTGSKSCRVVVPDDQLSLAIGKEGQNARLAAKLTGYKIDIKSASAAHEWEEEDALAEAERAAQAEEADDEDVFAEEPADGKDTLPDDEAPTAEEPAEDSTEEAPAEEVSINEAPAEEVPEAPEA